MTTSGSLNKAMAIKLCLLGILIFTLLALFGLLPFVNHWYFNKYSFYTNAQIVGEFQGKVADPLLGKIHASKICKDSAQCGGGHCLFIADEGSSFHKLPCHIAGNCTGRCDPLHKSPGLRRIVKRGRLAVGR